MHQEIRSFLVNLIEQRLHVEVSDAGGDVVLGAGGLDLESLQLLELCAQVRKQYGVGLDGDLPRMPATRLGELADIIASATPGGHSTMMITVDDIRSALAGTTVVDDIDQVGDDTELALDSFAIVWLSHVFQQQFDVTLDLGDPGLHSAFTSVNNIRDYLQRLTSNARVSDGG